MTLSSECHALSRVLRLVCAAAAVAFACAPSPRPVSTGDAEPMPSNQPPPSSTAATSPAEPPVAVHYSRGVGWSGTVALEIQKSEPSSLFRDFNDDGRPEIGLWQGVLPVERFDALVQSLRASGYDRAPGAPAAYPPGTKVLAIGEREAIAQYPRLFTFLSPPAELGPTLALIDELAGELRAHPRRVLRASAAFASPERGVRRGERALIELTLSNAGSEAFELSNPLHGSGEWNGLRLTFAQPDRDDRSIDLTAADVEGPSGARGAALTLAPGAAVHYALRARLDLPSGEYTATLAYHSLLEGAGPSALGGTLVLPLGSVSLHRDGWWKIWR